SASMLFISLCSHRRDLRSFPTRRSSDLSPLLIISLSNERCYGFFFRLARLWAYILFYSMGFRYQLHDSQPLDKHGSYMFVANHTSMMDIMLMLILNKNPFVFIGKKIGRAHV